MIVFNDKKKTTINSGKGIFNISFVDCNNIKAITIGITIKNSEYTPR